MELPRVPFRIPRVSSSERCIRGRHFSIGLSEEHAR